MRSFAQEIKLNEKNRELERKEEIQNQVFYGLYIKDLFSECFDLHHVFKSAKKFELKKVDSFRSDSIFRNIVDIELQEGREYYIDTVMVKEI